MKNMGGAKMAEFLPEGMEVIFYLGGSKTPSIGTVLKNCTFHMNDKFGGDVVNNSVGVVAKVHGVECWFSSDNPHINIIKFNPTPQQKMYYMLKGAECSSG